MSDPVILVVEDEESYVDALQISLRREGFNVKVARDGVAAIEMFKACPPDLVLLDLMLPRMSGVDVCRLIRAESDVPIIMVTAKSSEIDTVVGLEMGADDYVSKPYRVRELVARMRAALRRSPQGLDQGTEARRARAEVLTIGGVALDPGAHHLEVDGETVTLPRKEFALLHVLMANAGRVQPREMLIDRVWGADYYGDTKTLDVHIKRLRAKVELDAAAPTRITTVRGVGYKYERNR